MRVRKVYLGEKKLTVRPVGGVGGGFQLVKKRSWKPLSELGSFSTNTGHVKIS